MAEKVSENLERGLWHCLTTPVPTLVGQALHGRTGQAENKVALVNVLVRRGQQSTIASVGSET